ADGESESRAALMWLLLNADFRVEAVANGLDAAASLDNEVPDIAIISLYLPVFDGRRLIDYMRSSSRLCRVPILALGATHPFAPLPAGVEFLLKTAPPRLVLDVIKQLVQGSAGFRSYQGPGMRSYRRSAVDPGT
ncbi:MAG TPA: response regulator, partial [Polyangia bacterium]